VAEKARSHDLAMRIPTTEWQWDRKKLTIFFTGEQRSISAPLVRELPASTDPHRAPADRRPR
jgi:cell fate regulator YaaT (PSP1 superfamily)